MASSTFYSAAGANAPVDGMAYQLAPDTSWDTVHDGVGTHALDVETDARIAGFEKHSSTTFNWLVRGLFLFDISSLSGKTVTGATFSLYGQGKADDNAWSPTLNIYECAPADNDAIVAGDFNSFQTTPFCDTPITFAAYETGDPGNLNNFALNAAGIAFLQAAVDGDGIVKLGTREASYDVADVDPVGGGPNYHGDFKGYYVDKGVGYKPRLVVTYTVVAVGRSSGYIIG